MARDDWRIRIELAEEPLAERLLGRLGLDLGSDARELARELAARRLAVTREDNHVYVYAATGAEAGRAREIVQAVVRDDGDLEVRDVRLEHWLADEDRWDDEEPAADVEEETLARGFAPWEVRVECESADAARRLAEELEEAGYGVVRNFRYVVAGTATREDARSLARRVHGQVEAGGELVWEVRPNNPFAIFGGLGG